MPFPRSIALAAAVLGCATTAQSARLPLQAVPRSALCFTAGKPGPSASTGPVRVAAGGVRAVVAGDHSRSVEVAFTYEGPSAVAAPLANGELRRQIGLKLRAKDTCNVVYVMWHIEPTQTVAVSVKHNAGESKHAECGATGYDNLQPATWARAPIIERGVPHVLRADLDGNDLRVTADGIVV